MAGAWRRGMKWLSGRCLCCAAHGLSCLITTRTPSSQHTLLFDTGPDETIFERNAIRLGVDIGGVDAMMLSHGHWDHAGAMPRALQMMTLANGGRRVPTYLHPDMFASGYLGATPGGYTGRAGRAERPDFTGFLEAVLIWRRGRDSAPIIFRTPILQAFRAGGDAAGTNAGTIAGTNEKGKPPVDAMSGRQKLDIVTPRMCQPVHLSA